MTDLPLIASHGAADEPAPDTQSRSLSGFLRRVRYEVLPLPGTAELVEHHVPPDLPVTVTASPRRGLEPTLELTETLARAGFLAVPHVAARMVRDGGHLTEILHRVDEAGVREMFVIGGDSEQPAGPFPDAHALLLAVRRLQQSGGAADIERVGVAGYPEGHPLVPDAELVRALLAKQPLSGYVVTQMCFDPRAVTRWIAEVRRAGVRLPVHVGVAGVVDQRRLLAIAARIGVGASVRYLHRQRRGLRLLRPGGYRPDRLLGRLAPDLVRTQYGVAGLHVYTMGDVAATERWRRRLLDRLGDGERAHD